MITSTALATTHEVRVSTDGNDVVFSIYSALLARPAGQESRYSSETTSSPRKMMTNFDYLLIQLRIRRHRVARF
jgi:hypothetical protein